MIRILISGINGKMGHAVYAAVGDSSETFTVAAGVDHSIGAAFDCRVYPQLEDVREPFDVIIDFSIPDALEHELHYAKKHGIPIVVGTTGLTDKHRKLLQAAAECIPVFQAGNMSLGVNLQMALVQKAAMTLGSSFDVEIIERHHRTKVDSPSGTALMLANCISAQSPNEYEYVYGRHEKNRQRADNEIGIHSVRGGTLVGEHEVSFIGRDEVVEVTHKAFSKRVFAEGALRAAKFLYERAPGFYSMQDVVTEDDVASHVYSMEGQSVITVLCRKASVTFAASALECVATRGVFVDMISCTVPGGEMLCLGFSLPEAQLSDALNALKSLRCDCPTLDIHTQNNMTKLTVEGSGMAFRHGVAARLLGVLSNAGIHIGLITTSETKIELCVDAAAAVAAVTEIETHFLNQ